MSPLEMARIEGLSLLVYLEGMAKADIELMNIGWQETEKVTHLAKPPGNFIGGGFSQVQMSNKAQSVPVIVENMSHQEN